MEWVPGWGVIHPPSPVVIAGKSVWGGLAHRIAPWGPCRGGAGGPGGTSSAGAHGCHPTLCRGTGGRDGGGTLNQSEHPGVLPPLPTPPGAAFGGVTGDVTVPEPRGRTLATSWPRPCPCRGRRGSRSGSCRVGERVPGGPRGTPWRRHRAGPASPVPGHPGSAMGERARQGGGSAPGGARKS